MKYSHFLVLLILSLNFPPCLISAYQPPDLTDPTQDYYFFYEITESLSDGERFKYEALASSVLFNNTLNATINALHLRELEVMNNDVFGTFEQGFLNQDTGIFSPISITERYNLTWKLVIPLSTYNEWIEYALQRNGSNVYYSGLNGTIASEVTASTYKEIWEFSNITLEYTFRNNGIFHSFYYHVNMTYAFRVISITRHEFQFWGTNSPSSDSELSTQWFWIGILGTVVLTSVIIKRRKRNGCP